MGGTMRYQGLIIVVLYMGALCYGAAQPVIDVVDMIARSSIEKDLLDSGRYDLFKEVLAIYHFALDINEKLSENLLDKDPRPVPVQGAGLGLYLVMDMNPIYLCMPWGRLDIDCGIHSISLAQWVADAFFRKYLLGFESHEAERQYRRHNVKIDPSQSITFYGRQDRGLFEIPEDDLKNYRGTSTLVMSNIPGNFSCYSIKGIDGKPLPEQKERPQEKERSIYDINYEWDLLNIMYARELHLNYQQELLRAQRLFLSLENKEEH